MSRSLTVLYLPAWYPNKQDPMFGLFIQRHIEAVLPYLNNAVVLYAHGCEEKLSNRYVLEISKENGIHTYRVYFQKLRARIPFVTSLVNGYRYYTANSKGLQFILDKYSIDIAHVNVLTRAGLIALYLQRKFNIPFVVTEHWSRYLPVNNAFRGVLRKYFTKKIVRKATCVTTVTSNLRDAMIGCKLKGNYKIIPNVVDVNRFKPLDNKKENPIKEIVHVSCFEDKSKNISGLLRVVKKLSIIRSDFKLILVGDGIDFEKMQEYAMELGIYNEFAYFTGLLEGDELIREVQQADLSVLFSNYENLPVVLLESYACGIPILSTNVGGIEEFFNDSLGKLSEVGNEEAFVENLDDLLNNLDKYNQNKIRKYAVENFSNESIGRQFMEIYNESLKEVPKDE